MPSVAVLSVGLPNSAQKQRVSTERNAIPETICIYNATTGAKVASHRLEGTAAGLAVNSNTLLTSRTGKATIAMFVWGRESPLSRFASPEQLGPMRFSHDGTYVVAGSVSGSVYIWEECTGQLLCGWKAHYRKVLDIAFTDDDSVLITSSDDAMVHLWDFCSALMDDASPEKSLLKTFSANKMAVTGIASGVGGLNSRIATSSMDHSCRVFRAVSAEEEFCATFSSSLLCVAMDLAESFVYCGSMDGYLHFAELNTGRTHTIKAHNAALTCVQVFVNVNDRSLSLLTGSDDATLKWWDVAAKSPLRTVKMEGGCPVRQLFILEVESLDKPRKKTEGEPPTLKKLKETDVDDRWITIPVKKNQEERDTERPLTQPTSQAPRSSDSQLLSIANRLYNMASTSVLDEIVGRD